MNSIAGFGIAASEGEHSRLRRFRVPLIIAALGSATIVITNATAFASAGSTDVLSQPPPSGSEEVGYLGDLMSPAPAQHDQALETDAAARRFTGRIGDNLTLSLQQAGVPDQQGREYVTILARAIQLADGLSIDDRFDLVIERGEDGSLGRLLYIGLDRIGRADVALLKWTDGKQVIWVNADGVGGESSAAMSMPVPGQVTSRFGNRFHPILGHERFHKGVDLRASYGAPIVAAADGRVVSAGWHGGYGRQVRIAHAGGIQTTYGHMSRIAASPGETVRRGEVIGYVGSSGLSTGPHLHYEVYKDGRAVNPLSVKLSAAPAQLQGEKLHQFQGELRSLLMLPSS